MSTRASGPTGWAVFAGTVLAIVGAFNIIYGLAAIFRDEVITTTGQHVIVWDVTRYGWILFIFGIFQLLAGMALFAGASWARWTAVVLAGLNAIANVPFLTVQPLWTALIIALDILVIYQLSARWEAVDPAYYDRYDDTTRGATSARDEMTRHRTGL
ncbi:MAG TPA: hypothetical protein VMR48_02145 [Gaiellaceae bacterium]|jgi:hypothetical protein|nr:hypothetical protein [Gaiellaceae bacterium]